MSDRPAPRVSVVLPVRDGATHLPEAVDSVLGQTFADLELIVVDDGSTDATPAILAAYASRDPRVVVHRETGVGLPRAINAGVALARGEYLARMDGDDVALPDRLRLQVDYLDEHPAVAAVGGAVDLIDGNGRVVGHEDYPTGDAAIRELLTRSAPLVHPAATVRRDVLTALGGYRAAFVMGEDYDLWLRVAERHQLANLPDTVLRYRMHPGQASARTADAQALGSLAARLSAERRLAGQPDPLDGVARIDAAGLAALGVPADAMAAAVVEQCSWWARTMARIGYRSAARKAWAHGYRVAGAHPDGGALRRRLIDREVADLRQRGNRVGAALVPLRRGIRDRASRSSRR